MPLIIKPTRLQRSIMPSKRSTGKTDGQIPVLPTLIVQWPEEVSKCRLTELHSFLPLPQWRQYGSNCRHARHWQESGGHFTKGSKRRAIQTSSHRLTYASASQWSSPAGWLTDVDDRFFECNTAPSRCQNSRLASCRCPRIRAQTTRKFHGQRLGQGVSRTCR